MPITFDLKPDQQLVIFRHIDDVPDVEFLTFYQHFFENVWTANYMNLLIDLKHTNSMARSSQALQSLAELLRERLTDKMGSSRVAVVAPTDLSFGLARMYEVFSDCIPKEFFVFRSGDDACVWLGVTSNLEASG